MTCENEKCYLYILVYACGRGGLFLDATCEGDPKAIPYAVYVSRFITYCVKCIEVLTLIDNSINTKNKNARTSTFGSKTN